MTLLALKTIPITNYRGTRPSGRRNPEHGEALYQARAEGAAKKRQGPYSQLRIANTAPVG
jgi:hypothetical protein